MRSAAIAIATAALFLAACGRRGELLGTIGTPPDSGDAGDAGDAGDGSDGGAPVPADGGPPGPRFSAPRIVAPPSSPLAADTDPTFTGDLLELVFTSDRGGSQDLWVSRRFTASDPWSPPLPLNELNTDFAEYSASLSLDGLRIWFTTDRDMSPGRIWRSLRPSRASSWGPPFPVAELANPPGGPARDFGFAMEAAETLVMFSSNRLGALAYDLYFATRTASGMPWGTPALVPGLNGAVDDWDPFVAQGGLAVFFASTRAGAGDLFSSTRQSTNEAFPTPHALADLNSPFFESDPTLTQDLTYIMFDSNRTGNSELYEAHAAF